MQRNDLNIQSGIPISITLQTMLGFENGNKLKGFNRRRLILISLCAIFIAICSCLIAKFLVGLIDFITNVSFFGKLSLEHSDPSNNLLGLWVALIPVVGGVIVGLMAFFGSAAIRGHGIPEAMEQILTNQSKIKPTITYLKPISSAIAIGTGGPFGAEGPIIATGGALGSTIGQLIRITHNERKILLAAGATAGMSAIFGSPVAAIFLAIELLLFEFSARSIVPVILACITGAAGHHLLFETEPVFKTEVFISAPTNLALLLYSAMGIVMGFLSVIVSKIVYLIEDGFGRLPVHWVWWPAIGGLVVGLIGYFTPRTLGVGYNNITDILSGSLGFQVLLSLCFMKFISWVIALGSGTSGGTLAPLLTIGGAVGAVLGHLAILYLPQSGITLSLSALVGMAALFAGASRALLTSVVFALETTTQANAILPLLATCSASYIISLFLMRNTIMTEKIARRGIKTPESYEPDMLEHITVTEVMENDLENILMRFNIDKAISTLQEPHCQYFLVTNDSNEFEGIINIIKLYEHEHTPEITIENLMERPKSFVYSEDSLRNAVELMARNRLDILPVIASGKIPRIIGLLSANDILSIYHRKVDEHTRKHPDLSVSRGLNVLLKRSRKKSE